MSEVICWMCTLGATFFAGMTCEVWLQARRKNKARVGAVTRIDIEEKP